MKFTLVVNSAPSSHQGSYSAFLFAQSALKLGHELQSIFFYQDGIHNGSALIVSPQDELDLPSLWQQLADQANVKLCVCIAAGLKRGLIDEAEANRYNRKSHNLSQNFELVGLGQLVESAILSDRVIQFG